MPIRWIEGFEAVNDVAALVVDAWLSRRYTIVASPATGTVELVAGRTGGLAWMHPGGGAASSIIRTPELPDSLYWTVGMALRMKLGTGDLLNFYHKTNLVNPQLTVELSTSGTTTIFTVKRGGTSLGTYVYDFADTWVYFEIEAAISQNTSLAFVNLYIDGALVLGISGVSTAAVVTGGQNHVAFSGKTSNAVTGEFLVDDIYIAGGLRGSGEAALPPGILGDCVVQEFVPDANGDTVEATAVGEATVRECLDDATGATDTDTSYALVVGENNTVLLGFPAFVDFGEEVVAVEIEEFARGTAGGSGRHRPAIRRDAVTTLVDSPQTVPTAGAYTRISHILEEDPVTEEVWDFDDVNDTQFGFKQTS